MAMEFVPCDREVCPEFKGFAFANNLVADTGTGLDERALVLKNVFERHKAIYEMDRELYGLEGADFVMSYTKMLQNKAAAERAMQIATAWQTSQTEAAASVNDITCELAGTAECPRLSAAFGSIVGRHLKMSEAEGETDER